MAPRHLKLLSLLVLLFLLSYVALRTLSAHTVTLFTHHAAATPPRQRGGGNSPRPRGAVTVSGGGSRVLVVNRSDSQLGHRGVSGSGTLRNLDGLDTTSRHHSIPTPRHQVVSDTTLSHKGVSDTSSRHQIVSDTALRHHGVSDTSSPRHQGASDTNPRKQGVPDTTQRHQGVSDTAYKRQGVSDDTNLRNHRFSDTNLRPLKHNGIPDTTPRQQGVPDTTIRHTGIPDNPLIQQGVPDTTLRHTGISDTTLRQQGVSDTTVGHKYVSDTFPKYHSASDITDRHVGVSESAGDSSTQRHSTSDSRIDLRDRLSKLFDTPLRQTMISPPLPDSSPFSDSSPLPDSAPLPHITPFLDPAPQSHLTPLPQFDLLSHPTTRPRPTSLPSPLSPHAPLPGSLPDPNPLLHQTPLSDPSSLPDPTLPHYPTALSGPASLPVPNLLTDPSLLHHPAPFSDPSSLPDPTPLSDSAPTARPRPPGYLVYLCEAGEWCGGWADRQRGMLSVALLAAVTGRKFKVDMRTPCNLTNFLLPAAGAEDWWTMNEVNNDNNNNSNNNIDDADSDMIVLNDMKGRRQGEPPLLRSLLKRGVDLSARFPHHVIYVKTSRDVAPLLQRSPRYAPVLPHWARSSSQAERFSAGWSRLIAPSLSVTTRLRSLLGEALPVVNGSSMKPTLGEERGDGEGGSARRLVCAHLRMGRNPSMPEDDGVRNDDVSVETTFTFLQSYLQRGPSSSTTPTSVFIATDDQGVRMAARRRFGWRLLDHGGKIVHIDRQGSLIHACAGFETAILDQLILSRCDVLVISRSGFSRHAAYLRPQRSDGLFLLRHGVIEPYAFSRRHSVFFFLTAVVMVVVCGEGRGLW